MQSCQGERYFLESCESSLAVQKKKLPYTIIVWSLEVQLKRVYEQLGRKGFIRLAFQSK